MSEVQRLFPDLAFPERYSLEPDPDGGTTLVYHSVHDGAVIDRAITIMVDGSIDEALRIVAAAVEAAEAAAKKADEDVAVVTAAADQERERVSAELTRNENEGSRIASELSRGVAEGARADSELARVATEEARNAWEAYSGASNYFPGNKVSFNGSSYVNIESCMGVLPTNVNHWLLIAAKGQDGQGSGDMLASVYDPDGVGTNIFEAILQSAEGMFPQSGGTMGGDIDMGENDLNAVNKVTARKVTGLSTPSVDADAATKKYVDERVLVFANKTVPVSAWASSSTYASQGYLFRASIPCAGVNAGYRPSVSFTCGDAISGNFAPVAESHSGGVYIYCKVKPTATIAIASVVCAKGAQ